VVAIGPATAEALEARGVSADLLPVRNTSAGIVSLLGPWRRDLAGKGLLLPRSDLGPPGLPEALRALGARVVTVEAYRTVAEPLPPGTVGVLREGRMDAVLFSSASTVRNFASACRRARLSPRRARLVSIGPETSRTIRSAGWRVSAEASPHTLEGLVRALKRVLTRAPRPR
jgi:uroporphyrinogen-III synthase